MTTDFSFARDVLDKLDGWVNLLASPLLPPRRVGAGADLSRPELSAHTPETVMLGKCVRAVSGLHVALGLAHLGYGAECAALLRTVVDFCAEINAIGAALQRGGELPPAVQDLVKQYFTPRPTTPEQLEAEGRPRFPGRDDLMKAERHLAVMAQLDVQQGRRARRFNNMSLDAYVHGAYETTMELYDPQTGQFMMRGQLSSSHRQEFVTVVMLTLPRVVLALELTAAAMRNTVVFQAARAAIRALATVEALIRRP